MASQIQDLEQGSDAWMAYRLQYFGASEAAAMMGLSKKVKRTELLHMKSTGLAKEFSDWVQENVLDYGHEVEALARPYVERIIEDDLYPVTYSMGRLSASCDGLTMDGKIAFEHKQWNEELAASVAAGVVPDEHLPQCMQVLMVTGAAKVCFVVSDGTPEKMVYVIVTPDESWFKRIIAGWAQFEIDLEEYQPRQLAEKPQGEAIMALPALVANIRGEVVKTNLPEFRARAESFIAAIRTDLQNDQDFADAETTIKFCETAEKDIDRAKAAAIAQTASIDDMMRTVDLIKEQLRAKRLMLTRLVEKRKVEIKEAILAEAKAAYLRHAAELNLKLQPLFLPAFNPDFAGAMKNKRTLASLHDAVDTVLAAAKISTNQTAAHYLANRALLHASAKGYEFLFNDLLQVIAKPTEDFAMLVESRIAAHQKAESAKEEAQRARIREEERAKAEHASAEAARKVRDDEARQRVAAETKRQMDAQAAEVSAKHVRKAPAPLITGTRASVVIVDDHLCPKAVISRPTNQDIIEFGSLHGMDLDELLPRLESFIADVRAGKIETDF